MKTREPASFDVRWLGWVLPILALLVLQWGSMRDDAPRYAVAPLQILASLWDLAASGELWRDALASLRRSMSGFALGAALGVGLGLVCSVVRPLRDFFDPLVSLAYPVPKVALLPVFITWLGFGDASKVAMIALAVFFPTFINSLYGARSVNERWVWTARNLGATRLQIFFRVIVPASLPQVFNGLRSGLALSFVVLFAAEMVGSKNGLGNLVMKAEESMRFDLMYAAVLSIGLIGFVFDRALLMLRSRLLGRRFPGEASRG